MNRRDFLHAGAAGLALSAAGVYAAASPTRSRRASA